MKKILYTLIFSIGCSLTSIGQQWTNLGTQGYSAAGVQYPDLAVYNGTPYVAFKDAANAEKCTVMKYIGSSWVVAPAIMPAGKCRLPPLRRIPLPPLQEAVYVLQPAGPLYMSFRLLFWKRTVMKP